MNLPHRLHHLLLIKEKMNFRCRSHVLRREETQL